MARPSANPLIFIFVTRLIDSIGFSVVMPVLPRLLLTMGAHDLSQASRWAGLLLTVYAVMQFLCGPIIGNLSDQFGRRPVILAGFALATCASLGAIVATSASALIAMRLLQAIGGATGVAIGRAIIRDLFGRERSAQMLSLVASAMAVAPMVAPLIGGILDKWFGWQAIFLFAAFAS